MADRLQVSVISPERTVYEGEADQVVVPAWDGQLGVLRGHAPMLVLLGEGELRITDTVDGVTGEELEWTFPLAPGAELDVRADGLEFRPEDGWHSPSYGVRVATKFLRARRPARAGRDEQVLVLRAPS